MGGDWSPGRAPDICQAECKAKGVAQGDAVQPVVETAPAAEAVKPVVEDPLPKDVSLIDLVPDEELIVLLKKNKVAFSANASREDLVALINQNSIKV